MSIRSPDEALTSEHCFDASVPDSFPLDIDRWCEGVSGLSTAQPDFLFSSSSLDMNEAFELKHDTASVISMDSAYQSQTSASRRGAMMPEGYQSHTPQESRSRVSSQFLGSDFCSPTLSSEPFTGFQEQHPEISQMQLPSAAGDTEPGDNSFAYANYTTGQDYSQYTATSIPRFAPASGMDMGFSWPTADPQNYVAPYAFSSYPKSTHSLDTALYSNDTNELMFNAPPQPQRQLSRPRVDTTVRPSTLRHSSSYSTNAQSSRRPSTNDVGLGAFVISPTSAISAHFPSVTQNDFESQQLMDPRAEKEDTASITLAPQSVDDDEPLSAADAAEAKTMEEEQGKLARSHPLYQAQPDENGKYHCPNEGKAGCNHKATPLKCNYDKYVDSHLKPFRCNKKACVGVQFSSTACLLRHEREAHGMHGHGSKPHLCHYADCERSVAGNGFPRRYNLFDHMKRVHDFTGPATEPSPPAQQNQSGAGRKSTTRKRKSTADESGEKRHKTTRPTIQQQLEQRRGQLHDAFLNRKQGLIDMLSKMSGPNDFGDATQLSKELEKLHDISVDFKRSFGG